eukprot:3937019-Rhodomonas_salina.1
MVRKVAGVRGCVQFVPQIGSIWASGRLCCALEYVESVQYYSEEMKETVAARRACLVEALFETVRAMHSRGLTHGDIKPDNVLIRMNLLDILIVDFGKAAMVGDVMPGRPTYGTTGYRAPECLDTAGACQTAGLTSSLTLNCAPDLWAVGLTATCIFNARRWIYVHDTPGVDELRGAEIEACLHELCKRKAGSDLSTPWSMSHLFMPHCKIGVSPLWGEAINRMLERDEKVRLSALEYFKQNRVGFWRRP